MDCKSDKKYLILGNACIIIGLCLSVLLFQLLPSRFFGSWVRIIHVIPLYGGVMGFYYFILKSLSNIGEKKVKNNG